MNKSFLIIVDAYSKWAEVIEMSQTTTIEAGVFYTRYPKTDRIGQRTTIYFIPFRRVH